MPSKTKRSIPTKEMLRDAARDMQRRTSPSTLSFMVRATDSGTRRDRAACDDGVAWARASARARRRGLH